MDLTWGCSHPSTALGQLPRTVYEWIYMGHPPTLQTNKTQHKSTIIKISLKLTWFCLLYNITLWIQTSTIFAVSYWWYDVLPPASVSSSSVCFCSQDFSWLYTVVSALYGSLNCSPCYTHSPCSPPSPPIFSKTWNFNYLLLIGKIVEWW